MPVLSKPKVPYFTPDVRYCLILGNSNYEAIRFPEKDANGNPVVDADGKPTIKGFADLPAVVEDMKIFKNNIKQYGFDSDLDIVKKENLSKKALRKLFNGYQRKISDNADLNRKTLTVVYYGGHGMMNDNYSQIVLPDSQ